MVEGVLGDKEEQKGRATKKYAELEDYWNAGFKV